jgi:VTC domain
VTEGPGAAALAVAGSVADLPPVSLAEVTVRAALQTRTDHKYLVPADRFAEVVGRLAGQLSVLEIGARRGFAYESVYFDTPDLLTYRQHLQDRRRRYKVRTRAYLDSADCAFEVKLKGLRGETVKVRAPHPVAERARLTPDARAFLAELLLERYGIQAPPLVPTVTTSYRRTTLVNLAEGSRLTCDVDLTCTSGSRVADGPPGHVLVESKGPAAGGAADRALRALGVRPVGISKYCVAVALLNPGLRANPWHRTLRRYFVEQ